MLMNESTKSISLISADETLSQCVNIVVVYFTCLSRNSNVGFHAIMDFQTVLSQQICSIRIMKIYFNLRQFVSVSLWFNLTHRKK